METLKTVYPQFRNKKYLKPPIQNEHPKLKTIGKFASNKNQFIEHQSEYRVTRAIPQNRKIMQHDGYTQLCMKY